MANMNKKYKAHNFGFDLIMILLTGGLWLIWMVMREMRGNPQRKK